MDRTMLDANVLFSAAYKPDTDLRQLWQLADTTLLACNHAIREAENALGRVRPNCLPDLAQLLQAVVLVPDSPAGQALPAGVQLPDKDKRRSCWPPSRSRRRTC